MINIVKKRKKLSLFLNEYSATHGKHLLTSLQIVESNILKTFTKRLLRYGYDEV